MATAYPGARAAAAFPSPRCLACANCCVVFATSGVLFLSFIGFLLHRQPLYVLGVDEPAKASEKCYEAAQYYFFILLLSIATLAYDRCRPKRPEVESGQSLLAADTDFLGPGAHDEREQAGDGDEVVAPVLFDRGERVCVGCYVPTPYDPGSDVLLVTHF